MELGSLIHMRRFPGVLTAAPEAIVSPLIRRVRSGPNCPFPSMPDSLWHTGTGWSRIRSFLETQRLRRPRIDVIVQSIDRSPHVFGHKRRPAYWHAELRSIVRIGRDKRRLRADRSTYYSDERVRGPSSRQDVAPRSCDPYPGKQREISRSWMCRVTYRYVQFIRSYDVEAGIVILTPELNATGGKK